MMNTQELQSTAGLLDPAAKTLVSGQVMTLGTSGGEVKILSGRVWLTSPGDLDDHVLGAGESFRRSPGVRGRHCIGCATRWSHRAAVAGS
jgi:hypothetical protein